MAERQSWPAWRYGPNGEARIFASAGEVPEGWGKHPMLRDHVTTSEKTPDEGEWRKLAEEANRALQNENEELRGRVSALQHEVAQLRTENARLQEKAAAGTPLPQREQPEMSTVRRPRKLGKDVPGTPFTPKDETITVDEGRAERLKVLREAGIVISDDATDGDIEDALDWLEKQEKKS